MKIITKTIEQYCCVVEKNVPVVEITGSDGSKSYRCTMLSQCRECMNSILKARFRQTETVKKKD